MRSFALMLCVAALTGATAAAAEPVDGLLLYASFDGGATPDYAAGARSSEAVGTTVSDGVLAGAFRNPGAGASFPAVCNFELGRGTAAWWVRLAQRAGGSTGAGPRPLLLSAMNFQFMAEPRTNQWLFMTGTTPAGDNFTWSYSPSCAIAAIPPGRWTHVALSWDEPAGIKVIYLDGVERARASTRLMRNMPSGAPLVLGAGQPGDYDELLVWNRVLSAAEIAHVKTEPAAIAAAARALPAPQDAPWDIAPLPVERSALASLLAPGETFAVNIPVENRTDRAQHAEVTLTLLDLWEQPCGEAQHATIDLPPKGRQDIPVSFVAPRLGSFKVQVAVNGRTRDVASFGCVPAGNPPDHPFFGAHVQGSTGTAEFGRRIGFSRSRVHDMQQFTWWQRMEPERGQWNEAVRESYRGLSQLGYAHWGEWFAAPHWAVTLPDGTHPPRHDGYPRPYVPTDADAVRSYVRKTLEWYPDIHEWEVWNEPHVSGFWAGSPKDYAQLAAVMYDEAKQVRPDIAVFVQFGAGGPWYRDATAAGLLQHADGVSFHAYATTKDHPQTWARGRRAEAGAGRGRQTRSAAGRFRRGVDEQLLPARHRASQAAAGIAPDLRLP